MKHPSVALAALPAMILLVHAAPRRAARGPVKSVNAVRTNTGPVLDGNADDYEISGEKVRAAFVKIVYHF